MTQTERRLYFEVSPESPVMSVIGEFEQKHTAWCHRVAEVQKRYGASRVWISSLKLVAGFSFSELPENWIQRKNGMCIPNAKSKAGKAIRQEIDAIPRGMDGLRFSSMLQQAFDGEYVHHGENLMSWTTFERFGSRYILSVPCGCDCQPPGCIRLKMSEHWAIREATEASV